MSLVAAPLRNAVAITKSDSTVYDPALKAIYVGGAGDVVIKTLGNHTVTITAPPVGTMLYVTARSVMNATSATLLVGFW